MAQVVNNAALTQALLQSAKYAVRGPTQTTLYTNNIEAPTTNIWTGSVLIPSTYVGYHAGFSTSRPLPFATVGTVRSHDAGMAWYDIEVAEGVYDWSKFDAWLAGCKALGARAVYTLYGTPPFYAASTTTADLYGRYGGNQPPSSGGGVFTNTANFANALLAHVAAWESANGAVDFYLETWNEPGFPNSFWQGTAIQLANVARGLRQAITDTRPTTKLLSPGFVGDPTRIGAFMTADTGSGLGKSFCDYVAYHPYESNYPWYSFSGGVFTDTRSESPSTIVSNINGQVPDPDLPIWMTEVGHHNPGNFWNTLSDAALRRYLIVVSLEYAILGVQALVWYDYGGLAGDASKRTAAKAAFNELIALQGKTLTKRTVNRESGAIYEFSDSTVVSV